ncbi:MAG: hypothetical protein ABI383_16330 [Acidobacteriaceae bacterium]
MLLSFVGRIGPAQPYDFLHESADCGLVRLERKKGYDVTMGAIDRDQAPRLKHKTLTVA